MAKSKRWIRLAAAAAVALASETTLAQAASTDPQVVADNTETARVIAQTALINAKNTNIAAKYGAAATAPQGAISGVDKFLAMGQWAHAKAIYALGATVLERIKPSLEGVCTDKTMFVTSVADGRPTYVVASAIHDQLKRLTLSLRQPKKGPSIESLAGAAAAIRGVVGTLDSLVGLFRSDYAVADIATTADDLALRMKIANLLTDNKLVAWANIRVDGLNRAPVDTLPLMAAYRDFDAARIDATNRNKTERNAARKAKLGAIIAIAEAFDKAITTQPTTAGSQPPLVAAALALENPPASACVLFVTYSIATSAITRKRLLSRNDHITVAMGGFLKLALFDSSGTVVVADLISIKEKFSQDLKSLEK